MGLFTATNNGDITGWSTQNGGHWYFNTGTQFGDAQDGARFLNLANDPATDPISQSFAVTANKTYEVSYWLGMRADNAGASDVVTGAIALTAGNASGSLSLATPSTALTNISHGANPATGWQRFSFRFTPDTNTNAMLTFTDGNGPGNGYACIDNVAVNAVPEPSTMAMAVSATIGLLAYAWRRGR